MEYLSQAEGLVAQLALDVVVEELLGMTHLSAATRGRVRLVRVKVTPESRSRSVTVLHGDPGLLPSGSEQHEVLPFGSI